MTVKNLIIFNAKIIVLSDDDNQAVTADNNLSCLDMIQGEVGVIDNAPGDLSSNPEYLKGYGHKTASDC